MNHTEGITELSCDNGDGPGASAANTGVSPGPDRSIDLDVTERGLAPAMVEPASAPVIHRPEDQWAYEHIADSQTCPVCFAPVADNDTREVREVMLATYTCGGEGAHRWNVSWVLGQVAA